MREKTLFQLGSRLGLCAAMVRPGCRLADIGTDHGYLPVWLAKTGVIRSAVAADVREGPLQSARQNIERYGVEEQVTARLSDGLDLVSAQEADDIVIAGMGGELIARLVDRAAWLRDPQKHLILQPNELRGRFAGFPLGERIRCVPGGCGAGQDGHVNRRDAGLVRSGTGCPLREGSILFAAGIGERFHTGGKSLSGGSRLFFKKKEANGMRHTGALTQAEALEMICSFMEQEAGEGSAATGGRKPSKLSMNSWMDGRRFPPR